MEYYSFNFFFLRPSFYLCCWCVKWMQTTILRRLWLNTSIVSRNRKMLFFSFFSFLFRLFRTVCVYHWHVCRCMCDKDKHTYSTHICIYHCSITFYIETILKMVIAVCKFKHVFVQAICQMSGWNMDVSMYWCEHEKRKNRQMHWNYIIFDVFLLLSIISIFFLNSI